MPIASSPIGRRGTLIWTGSASAPSRSNPDRTPIAAEGALRGSLEAHGLLARAVIPGSSPGTSDDAGLPGLDPGINVGQHGLCWAHAERPVHKLDAFTDAQRAAQRRIRALIWRFYRSLKAYRRNPTTVRKAALQTRFDRIFASSRRLRRPRPLARAPPCQQERVAEGARPAGNSAARQRFAERHPPPGHQAQDQQRNPQRRRPRSPRRLPRARQDLRKARRRLLGLSRRTAPRSRQRHNSLPSRNRQPPRRSAALTARTFAPLTKSGTVPSSNMRQSQLSTRKRGDGSKQFDTSGNLVAFAPTSALRLDPPPCFPVHGSGRPSP